MAVAPMEPTSPTDLRRLQRDWHIFIALTFLFGFGFAIYNGVFQNFIREDLHASPLDLGIIESLREIPGLCTVFLAGTLVLLAESRVAGLGLAIGAVGIAATGLVRTIPPLIAISVFWSVGFHLYSTVSNAITLALAKGKEGGRHLGMMNSVGLISTIAGLGLAWIARRFLPHLPYSTYYLLSGAAILVAAILATRLSPHAEGGPRESLVFRRDYGLYYLLTFLEGCRRQIFGIFAFYVLVSVYKVPLETMLLLQLIYSLMAAATAPWMGKLIDRVGERGPLTAYAIAMIVIFIAYANFSSIGVLYAIFIIDRVMFTFSLGLTTYLHRIVRPGELTPSLAMGTTMNHVAAVTVPILGAWLWQGTGNYRLPFVAGVCIASVSLMATFLLPSGPRSVAAETPEGPYWKKIGQSPVTGGSAMKMFPRGVWGRAGGALLVLVVVLAVGAYAAWRILSQRPGEAAIAFIPADAGMVITLDTTPSASQTVLFKRIGDAMEREGLMVKLDDLLGKAMEKSPIVKELRPYATRSLAVAVWVPDDPKTKAEPPMATLVAVTDNGAVEGIVAKYGTPEPKAGARGYRLKDANAYATVVSGYLVISNVPDILRRVENTANGGTPSVASMPEYKSAREALPADANFMFFLSPSGIKSLDKMQGGGSLYAGYKWVSFSLALRNEGLAFDMQYPGDAKAGQSLAAMAQMKALQVDLLKRLPAGAYGFQALAQPGRIWKMTASGLDKNPQVKKTYEEGLRGFEKEVGLSVAKDIVPALDGDFVVGVYPSNGGKSADLVVLLTDANGADPGSLADKVRAVIEQKSGKADEKPIRFVSKKVEGATLWALDEPTRQALQKGASDTAPAPRPDYGHPQPPGAPMPPPPPPSPMSEFAKGKTVAYAIVGRSVILASSQEALDRAVAAYQGKATGLGGDPVFQAMATKVVSHSRSTTMVDLGKIMAALKSPITEGLKGGPIKADDVLGVFGDGKMGFVASYSYDGQVFKGSGLLPLDFDRVIRLLGGALKSAAPPSPDSTRM